MHHGKYLLGAVAILRAGLAAGGVFLNPGLNALVVYDYPPDMPCSLEQLAKVDRAFGWGRVSYDPLSATCTINGDLVIGANDGTDTVLKVGSAERPRETLIMNGNLYIHPYFVRGENEGKYWQAPKRMNALVLGEAGNTSINATLSFDCAPDRKWTLFCGRMPGVKPNYEWGGGLYVYNSAIAPLNPAPGHEIGHGEGLYMEGSAVFEHANISGVKGMLYRMGPGINKDYSIRDTVFENVGVPLAGGAQVMKGCAFLHCETAVVDRGSINAELTDCVFRDNAGHWSLTYSDKGLTLVDCEWDEPRKGNVHRMWTNNEGKKQYPKLIVRRHVVVEVTDAAGKPVADAAITFRPEQEGCDLLRRTFKTDERGRTPDATDAENGLLLTDYIQTATETPDQPESKAFTYTITAEKGGKRAVAEGVRADAGWKTVPVIWE